MVTSVYIKVDSKLYLKDPQEYKLGKKIIAQGIQLLDELGFEAFTFKKLASEINSTEAGIYRYFANKHYFLLYLLAWYWEWVRYRIDYNTMNINEPTQKLRIVIQTIADTIRLTTPASYVDRDALQRVIIAEGTKGYHTKEVDHEQKEGLHANYIALVQKISGIIHDINPDFPYPKALATNLLETANHQLFFAQHLPAITELSETTNHQTEIQRLMEFFAFQSLGISPDN